MIRLSQRNLLRLLFDLETRGTHLLTKPDGSMVLAETDARHYQGREYGCSSPNTETFIYQMERIIPRLEQQIKHPNPSPPEWARSAARLITGRVTKPTVVDVARIIAKCARDAGVV